MSPNSCLLAVLLIPPALTQAPQPSTPATAQPQSSGTLRIGGDVQTPQTLTIADLKAMPRKQLDTKDEHGQAGTYEGVLLGDLLKRAGVPLGADLRGAALATYVVAGATDGYQVVYSIGEVDPALTSADIIVADTLDGKPLTDRQGPLRIVVPHDTKGARWVRMLERIDVVRLKK